MEVEIERQQRAKAGVEQLAKVYKEQPDFTDEKGAEDVTRQLVEVSPLSKLEVVLFEYCYNNIEDYSKADCVCVQRLQCNEN